MAVSTSPSALPPASSGSASPSQPSCAISFHSASLSPRGSSQSARTWAGFACSSRKARAEFFSNCWSGLKEKSTMTLLLALHAVRADLLGETEHPLADDVLLDLGRARVDGARARPQQRIG